MARFYSVCSIQLSHKEYVCVLYKLENADESTTELKGFVNKKIEGEM